MPSGKTLTGAWGEYEPVVFAEGKGFNTAQISFPLPVVPAPTPVYVPSLPITATDEEREAYEEEWASEGCPGTAAEPAADPGVLCVYVGDSGSIAGTGFFRPTASGFDPGVSSFGGLFLWTSTNTGPIIGTWAVTAE